MSKMQNPSVDVSGFVARRFEPVRDAFRDQAPEVGRGGASFAVVHEGETVIDLWTGYAGTRRWRRETRSRIFSATKGLATVAIARLAERGLIDVEAPVANYWPEFGNAGKQSLTVAHVLSHAAGLPTVPSYGDFMQPNGDGWDRTDEVLRRLEQATPMWTPGTNVMYHGLTWGWLVGEIVRRVSGHTVSAVLRSEVLTPMGLAPEFDLGTPRDRQGLLAPLEIQAFEEWRTRHAGDVRDAGLARDVMLGMDVGAAFGNPSVMEMELPAVNATATARTVASVYGALANGGMRGDYRLLDPQTIEAFAKERQRGMEATGIGEARYGLGFQRPTKPRGFGFSARPTIYSLWGPHDESFGHDGAGGQIGFADPISRLGVGFMRSELSQTSTLSASLLRSVYDCLD